MDEEGLGDLTGYSSIQMGCVGTNRLSEPGTSDQVPPLDWGRLRFKEEILRPFSLIREKFIDLNTVFLIPSMVVGI